MDPSGLIPSTTLSAVHWAGFYNLSLGRTGDLFTPFSMTWKENTFNKLFHEVSGREAALAWASQEVHGSRIAEAWLGEF